MAERAFEIGPAEMQHLIDTLGAIGEQPGGGIIRHVYDPAWVAARAQLAEWMRAAGLAVRTDAVGNLFGRLEGESPRTVLTGSHFDTVLLGGRYDGALGVLSALAALRVLGSTAGRPARSLEMVALCEEEDSRFHANFWGTRGILGLIDPAEFDSLRDDAGISIADAMRTVGLAPERLEEAVRTDLDAFVELHIEQGRILADEHMPLGIVDAITGLYRFRTTVEGRTDHAGTTPMDLRRDAFQAAAHIATAMTRVVEQAGRPAVITNGWWDVQPGAWNIVPGLAHFSVDLRHPDEPTKQRLAAEVRQCAEQIAAERSVSVRFDVVSDVLPMGMDPHVKAELQAAAEARGVRWKPMISGAGHDSQVMATRVPTGMLFVPSVEGRSHSAAEFTTAEDAARGATVLATALHRLAFAE
ncbi:MAG TPA: M20 family metallo-hydrolase [Chloroflexota bacterium]|nr:M20 family metallo-hydrolase [Chloroflexota bacterium]